MTFYLSFFTLVLAFGFIGDVSRRSIGGANTSVLYNATLFCISVVLIIIMAIRVEVGTDYLVYVEHARHMQELTFREAVFEYEFFFIVFSEISYSLFGSMQFFYLIIGLVIVTPFALSIKYYDESQFYVFLFFFVTTVFFISMNAMRQMASFSIVFYALRYLRDRGRYFLFLVLFASLWHYSAIVYLSIYILDRINLRRIYLPILVSFILFKSALNSLMIHFIEEAGLPGKFYFLVQEGASSKLLIVISLVVFFLFNFFVKRDKNDANLFYNIALVNVGVSVFADGIPGAYRLVYIFFPFYCFISPFMIRNSRIKPRIVMAIVLLGTFSVYFYRQQILGNANEILPYQTIFG